MLRWTIISHIEKYHLCHFHCKPVGNAQLVPDFVYAFHLDSKTEEEWLDLPSCGGSRNSGSLKNSDPKNDLERITGTIIGERKLPFVSYLLSAWSDVVLLLLLNCKTWLTFGILSLSSFWPISLLP